MAARALHASLDAPLGTSGAGGIPFNPHEPIGKGSDVLRRRVLDPSDPDPNTPEDQLKSWDSIGNGFLLMFLLMIIAIFAGSMFQSGAAIMLVFGGGFVLGSIIIIIKRYRTKLATDPKMPLLMRLRLWITESWDQRRRKPSKVPLPIDRPINCYSCGTPISQVHRDPFHRTPRLISPIGNRLPAFQYVFGHNAFFCQECSQARQRRLKLLVMGIGVFVVILILLMIVRILFGPDIQWAPS
jgi:hypothetical protein